MTGMLAVSQGISVCCTMLSELVLLCRAIARMVLAFQWTCMHHMEGRQEHSIAPQTVCG